MYQCVGKTKKLKYNIKLLTLISLTFSFYQTNIKNY